MELTFHLPTPIVALVLFAAMYATFIVARPAISFAVAVGEYISTERYHRKFSGHRIGIAVIQRQENVEAPLENPEVQEDYNDAYYEDKDVVDDGYWDNMPAERDWKEITREQEAVTELVPLPAKV